MLKKLAPSESLNAKAWLANLWRPSEHAPLLETFLLGLQQTQSLKESTLFAHIHQGSEESLVLSWELPPSNTKAVYFARAASTEECVHSGLIGNNGVLEGLLQLVGGLTGTPAQTCAWSQNAQREFKGQLQALLADLTEAVHLAEGRTRLYIPSEPLLDLTAALQDKALVQRMESILLHWTRQVKHVVSQQGEGESARGTGPLAEIQSWHRRGDDLAGICAQLDSPEIARVVEMLKLKGSCYLPAFQSLRASLDSKAVTARDNVQFMSVLEEPCTKLEKAAPHEIAPMLPHIAGRLRLLWNLSPFFGTPERMTGLLRQFCNQIVAVCTRAISVADALSGDVDAVIRKLQDSTDAAASWQGACRKTALSIASATPGHAWELEPAAVFAQLDIFAQRCRNLMDVCLDRKQFGAEVSLPTFGGTSGAETKKALQDIQVGFAKAAHKLVALQYSPLDVNDSRWSADFAAYTTALGVLERRFAAAASAVIERAGSLQARMQLIMAFNGMAKRETVKKAMAQHERGLFSAIEAENAAVARTLDQIRKELMSPRSNSQPRYAGAAAAAACLTRRINATWAAMQAYLPALLETREGTVAAQAHAALQSSLQVFTSAAHADWYQSIGPDLTERLKRPLLKQDKSAGGTLSVNTDPIIQEVLEEALGWERLRLSLPFPAADVAGQRERLRKARINIGAVSRSYNKVLSGLQRSERRLFHDRLRQLDRKILAGVSKIGWAMPKSTIEAYCTEALRQCRDTAATVADWRGGQAIIAAGCQALSEVLLLGVEGKRVYPEGAFLQHQEEHMVQAREALERHHGDIASAVGALRPCFAADSAEVQREWLRYTEKVDDNVEEALRAAVRRSLSRLARLLLGDKKADVQPLFAVRLSLEKSGRIELRPDVQEVFAMVKEVIYNALDVTACVHRVALPEATAAAKIAEEGGGGQQAEISTQAKPSFCESVRGDREGTQRTEAMLSQSMPSVVDRAQTLLLYWEKNYKQLWDQDREAFIRRYEKAQKPVEAFEGDIRRHRDIIDDIMSESASEAIKFLHVDCAPLKQALVAHCEAWIGKFTNLLTNLATGELAELQEYVRASSAALTQHGTSDSQQASSAGALHQKLSGEREGVQAKLEQLRGRFRVLADHEAPMPESEMAQLAALQHAWETLLESVNVLTPKLEAASSEPAEDVGAPVPSEL
ncbi:hypothetical protein WJX75_009720 [Coccomyxa subellipsoidea]|uniref:Dynein heavy chain tail domain-containing protein n=1 Tax=Coccomyxa subellipsoidea TaxID=248742 RepID=A0ABR2YTL8_9CHLO